MDTMTAFAMGEANRGAPLRVFDWDTAARLIKERGVTDAEAGLSEDWPDTSGEILSDGDPVPSDDTYTYLASTWATPVVLLDGDEIDCWKYQDDTPDWGPNTYWPDSALQILTDSEDGA